MGRRKFVNLLSPLLALALGLLTLPRTATADSDDRREHNLNGSYSYLFTGTIFLPPPFDAYNGPFFRMGEMVADGKGNLTVTHVGNFNGTVSHGTFTATYKFTSDNHFILTIPNAPIPSIPPNIPTVFTMEGVLADNGKIAKCVLSGVTLAGQSPPNIGSVIIGDILKQ